jgi:hypothetical protein
MGAMKAFAGRLITAPFKRAVTIGAQPVRWWGPSSWPLSPRQLCVPGVAAPGLFRAPSRQTIAQENLFVAEVETRKNSAFMKALKPSPALATIVGTEPLPRTEVTKRIWDYIKQHNLQNPANKRNILCDDVLKAVMGKDEVTMFEMTGLVGKHLK